MATKTGTVATPNAKRYMRQLAKHWSHKFEATIDGDRATVVFPEGSVAFHSTADQLTIEVNSHSDADLDELVETVVSHVDRFAFREAPLAYEW